MKIACIEDNEMDLALIKKAINKTLSDVDIINFRYLNDFIETEKPYDLVITDLRLPDSYGPEVIERIRKISGKPIIVLSGVGGHEIPDRIIEVVKNSGATIFLSKNKNGFDDLPIAIKNLI